jgi:predicted metal-dependent hydrolase
VAQSHADWIFQKRALVMEKAESRPTVSKTGRLPIRGIPHAVLLQRGKRAGATLSDGALLVMLRDPASNAELTRVLRRFIKEEAARVLTSRVRELFADFSPRPATFPELSFRWMRSRWGSCTASKNHITLNEKLLLVPPTLADYVIYHELCHFNHQNHSSAFWAHLAQYVPDHKELRRLLNEMPLPDLELEK